MVRVIAGRFRSRRLRTLEGKATRPTSDRLKEALFSRLQDRLAGSCFLDCFAGSGSIGIEAISRGAGLTVFVESSVRAAGVIQGNLEVLGLSAASTQRLMVVPAESALRILNQAATKFDIVFLDPPYAATAQYQRVLELLQDYGLLNPGAIVVAKHSKRFDLEPRVRGLVRYRRIQQGDSVLSMFRQEGEATAKP